MKMQWLALLVVVSPLAAKSADAQYYWPPATVEIEVTGPRGGWTQHFRDRMMRRHAMHREMAARYGFPIPQLRIVEVHPPSAVQPGVQVQPAPAQPQATPVPPATETLPPASVQPATPTPPPAPTPSPAPTPQSQGVEVLPTPQPQGEPAPRRVPVIELDPETPVGR